jgi:hypothetical protein
MKYLAVETFAQRVNKQMRREIEEADQEWIRKQKLVDHLWQTKLDAEAPLDDGHVEIAGFREQRFKVGFHKSNRDPDWRT